MAKEWLTARECVGLPGLRSSERRCLDALERLCGDGQRRRRMGTKATELVGWVERSETHHPCGEGPRGDR
jgi:hypothetical protein